MKYCTQEEKFLIFCIIGAAFIAAFAIPHISGHFIDMIQDRAKERFLLENACPECEPVDISKYRHDVPIIEDDSG